MFCKYCGTKIGEGVQFCQNCGRKSGTILTIAKTATKPTPDQTALISTVEFYGEDWRRKKVFVVASRPYFDVMIDKKYLYIIQMPKYSSETIGLIVGLIIFNLIGALVGSSIGSSSDNEKRKRYRSTWINADYQLISNDYTHDIFLKIPLENLKGNLVLGKNKFTLKFGEKMIVLQKGQKEFGFFRQSIEKYVL